MKKLQIHIKLNKSQLLKITYWSVCDIGTPMLQQRPQVLSMTRTEKNLSICSFQPGVDVLMLQVVWPVLLSSLGLW